MPMPTPVRERRPILAAALLAVAASLLVLVPTAPAEAGLIGKQMDAVYYYPDSSTPYSMAVSTPSSFTVGPGHETDILVENVTNLRVDFDDESLTIVLTTSLGNPTWTAKDFNGPIFSSPDPLGIIAASVDGTATTMAGFDSSRVRFTGDKLLIDWGGLGYVDGTVVKIDFRMVPEPATLAIFGLGLLGLGMRRRTGSG